MTEQREKVLVVVQLSGGNDYLNCIVPWEDPRYRDSRASVRITEEDVIPLDNGLGLNPGMAAFKDLYDEGKVAIIHGIGYPVPSRSHFRSMDIWHTATPDRVGEQGWLGQAIRQIDPSGSGMVMDYLGQTGLDALKGADILNQAPAMYESTVEYPDTPIAKSLKGVAQVHMADLGTRVFYTVSGGWDTHTNEIALQRHLWEEVSTGLRAFFQDLKEHELGPEVTVLVFSEFGRRVKDNGNGTDHGSGGVSFVIGDQVKGGHYSEYPSLDVGRLIEGDLAYNFDFRGLYTDLLEDWLNLDAQEIVGGQFEKISPFATAVA